MELKAFFHTLDFRHVFREHNKSVDSLSKEALRMVMDLLSFTEYYEEIAIGEDKLQLFKRRACTSYSSNFWLLYFLVWMIEYFSIILDVLSMTLFLL